MVADMSHAFPASSHADRSRMRLNAAECGELSATDQGLENQVADWHRVLGQAEDALRIWGSAFALKRSILAQQTISPTDAMGHSRPMPAVRPIRSHQLCAENDAIPIGEAIRRRCHFRTSRRRTFPEGKREPIIA